MKKTQAVVEMSRRVSADAEYLPLRDMAAVCGMSVSSLLKLVELHADFPRPVRLSTKLILFDRAALKAWMLARAASLPTDARGMPIAPVASLRGAVDDRPMRRQSRKARNGRA